MSHVQLRQASLLHDLFHDSSHLSRRSADSDTSRFQGFDLVSGCAFAASNNGTSMPHSSARGGCQTCRNHYICVVNLLLTTRCGMADLLCSGSKTGAPLASKECRLHMAPTCSTVVLSQRLRHPVRMRASTSYKPKPSGLHMNVLCCEVRPSLLKARQECAAVKCNACNIRPRSKTVDCMRGRCLHKQLDGRCSSELYDGPAMKETTGLSVPDCLMNSAASSSAVPPISPIIMMPSVCMPALTVHDHTNFKYV